MTEIVQEAKIARENLAGALGLLQSAEAGNLIDSVAPPVAMAMGALHSLEVAGGRTAPEAVPQALGHVQKALAALQLVPTSSHIVDEATAQVAQALGLLHGLSRALGASKPVTKTAAPPATPDVNVAAPKEPSAPAGTQPIPAAPNHAATVISSRPAEADRPSPPPASDLGQASTAPQPRAAAAGLDQTTLSREAPELTDVDRKERERRNAAFAATTTAPSVAPTPPAKAPASTPKPSRPPGSVLVEANLGAHSDTNFFKGLSGNDVVDDGGIFIATYEIPKPGTPLWIRVTLPGGYEFEAAGAVRWTREANAGDAAPGFGAIFIELSPEARQLVYRYVRNREPLFYDDM